MLQIFGNALYWELIHSDLLAKLVGERQVLQRQPRLQKLHNQAAHRCHDQAMHRMPRLSILPSSDCMQDGRY